MIELKIVLGLACAWQNFVFAACTSNIYYVRHLSRKESTVLQVFIILSIHSVFCVFHVYLDWMTGQIYIVGYESITSIVIMLYCMH